MQQRKLQTPRSVLCRSPNSHFPRPFASSRNPSNAKSPKRRRGRDRHRTNTYGGTGMPTTSHGRRLLTTTRRRARAPWESPGALPKNLTATAPTSRRASSARLDIARSATISAATCDSRGGSMHRDYDSRIPSCPTRGGECTPAAPSKRACCSPSTSERWCPKGARHIDFATNTNLRRTTTS